MASSGLRILRPLASWPCNLAEPMTSCTSIARKCVVLARNVRLLHFWRPSNSVARSGPRPTWQAGQLCSVCSRIAFAAHSAQGRWRQETLFLPSRARANEIYNKHVVHAALARLSCSCDIACAVQHGSKPGTGISFLALASFISISSGTAQQVVLFARTHSDAAAQHHRQDTT